MNTTVLRRFDEETSGMNDLFLPSDTRLSNAKLSAYYNVTILNVLNADLLLSVSNMDP